MSFKPSEINEDHVRKGLEEIKKTDKPLHNGTRWQVVIDGKPYPPKEVMRFARKEYDGSNDWPYGGGPSTNKFLEKMGFEVNEISDNIDDQINFDPYFNIPGIWEYQKIANTKYDSSTKEAKWYYDTRMKLYYLIQLLSNRLGEQFDLVYTEQPNAQKGRGKINFKNYVLAGFATKPNFGDDIFIKLSFTNLKENPHFALDIDINFRKGNSRYASRREEIYHSNITEWKIDGNFPNNWTDLLNLISPQVVKLVEKFKAYISEFNHNTITHKQMNLSENHIAINQILYGPPGTGKTYNTINKAIAIIDPDFDFSQSRKIIKNKFDELVSAGQIVFTTFHQSMSYEDFIEGIKPIAPTTENSSINYKVENGIFKNLCKTATEKKGSINFDEAYSLFVNDVIENGTIELTSLVQKKPFTVRINSNETAVAIPKTTIASEMGVTKDMMREYVVNGVVKEWRTYTTTIGEYLKSKYNVSVQNIDNTKNNYVLIIDEINRGNISQIFGELITLIEDDKRLGKDEALEVTLPYSKDKFGVPLNLYIIGTMNTADRSVEALDTALRRRFSFEEMMPMPELLSPSALYCQLLWSYESVDWNDSEFKEKEDQFFSFAQVSEDLISQRKEIWETMKADYIRDDFSYFDDFDFNGFNLQVILETINNRIEVLLNRDHLIGHSYFLNVRTEGQLKATFKNNIIPLLQEYFYGDYEKIGLILGSGFFEQSGKYSKEIFASFTTQNYPDNGTILRMKTIDEEFDMIAAVNLLLNTKNSQVSIFDNE